MSKIIKNINVLDITSAHEQAFDDVSKMENINVLLYSKTTSNLLASIAQQNINVRAEVPEKTVLTNVNGRYEITSLNSDTPLFIIVNGKLIIQPDATAESLEKGIAGMIVNGKIICPEGLKGIVQRKVVNHNGRLVSYIDDADLVSESIRLNNTYLNTLPEDSRMSFVEEVVMLDDVDISLLNKKLHTIEFMNELVIREDLLPAVNDKIVNVHKANIKTIPTNTYYVENDLILDASMLKRIRNKCIHTTGVMRIESDVNQLTLVESIESLHSDKMILCRDELKDEVLKKTSDPFVQVVGYIGKLHVVEGDYKLTGIELKYTKEEPIAFIVHGILDIAPDVDPQLLFDSLGSIINYGVVNGSHEQCGVIQTKLLINKGVVSVRDSNRHNVQEHDDPSINQDDGNIYIQNINYLKM